MNFEECKAKAHGLPLSPGVYLMRDSSGTVIYVGKAKKLKNRVSQYFQDSGAHSPKTRMMVSKIADFDVIVAASEFEALVLESSLIKRHMPKYNILLKDDKGYPYIRLNLHEQYPKLALVNRVQNDGAQYFGPYGSRGITQNLIETISLTLRLPSCTKVFPKELGNGRPCLHFHMGQCDGWCKGDKTETEYQSAISQAKLLLDGKFQVVADEVRQEMLRASEQLNFELAASLRDRLKAIEALGKKQLVTAEKINDTDVIGYAETETKCCFTVLHYMGGNLVHKEYQVFPLFDDKEGSVNSLITQYYLDRPILPNQLLLPFAVEDMELLSQYAIENNGRKLKIFVPQRGDNRQLVELACKNAWEEANRLMEKEERRLGKIQLLGKMLSIDPPRRIEAFDISNLGNSDIVAGMVVFVDGVKKPSEYKKFQIQGLAEANDYESMFQAVMRRFLRFQNGDKGFSQLPDLLLIDGGATHAATALQVLAHLEMDIPVFGMVKDDKHRTRALITSAGEEIRIDNIPAVFSFIGSIQEETHRFTISYQKNLRGKRLKKSALDNITGIGPTRKQALLKYFKSISAIGQASFEELSRLLPQNAARAVYDYFHEKEGG